MRYRVRQGSAIDRVRYGLLGIGFWAVIFAAIVTTYPV
jgi:hypothetical protein